MGEDNAEVYTRTEGLVKSLVIYCHKPVCLDCQAQRFSDRNVASYEWVKGEEALLAVY